MRVGGKDVGCFFLPVPNSFSFSFMVFSRFFCRCFLLSPSPKTGKTREARERLTIKEKAPGGCGLSLSSGKPRRLLRGERRHNPFLWIVNQTLATNQRLVSLASQETTRVSWVLQGPTPRFFLPSLSFSFTCLLVLTRLITSKLVWVQEDMWKRKIRKEGEPGKTKDRGFLERRRAQGKESKRRGKGKARAPVQNASPSCVSLLTFLS